MVERDYQPQFSNTALLEQVQCGV